MSYKSKGKRGGLRVSGVPENRIEDNSNGTPHGRIGARIDDALDSNFESVPWVPYLGIGSVGRHMWDSNEQYLPT